MNHYLNAYQPPEKLSREARIDQARERFGQRFAHEPGATWKPRQTPVLTEWLQKRGKQ